jgi:hypothetical protein
MRYDIFNRQDALDFLANEKSKVSYDYMVVSSYLDNPGFCNRRDTYWKLINTNCKALKAMVNLESEGLNEK